jgi:hypothetical protein
MNIDQQIDDRTACEGNDRTIGNKEVKVFLMMQIETVPYTLDSVCEKETVPKTREDEIVMM